MSEKSTIPPLPHPRAGYAVSRPSPEGEGRVVWQGKYLEVRHDGTWEFAARVGGLGAAVILATTDAREIVLVEQLRRSFGRPVIELPAGLIGDDGDYDPATAAARELAEETGFVATGWTTVGDFATSAGMSAETFTLFRATGLTRTGPGGGIDGEDITVHIVPLAGITEWVAAARGGGCVIDGRLIVALGLL